MLGNYKYCNPCCWCANYEDREEEKGYCAYQKDKVNDLYTCDNWEEIFEDEDFDEEGEITDRGEIAYFEDNM